MFHGSGGADVGSFTATVTFPNPLLTWTNQGAAASINRGGGLTVNWSGGSSGTYVIISGDSSGGSANGSYTCIAPQSAGTFTVPAYILLGLPAGTGSTTVANFTSLSTFTAPGLDFGGSLGSIGFEVDSNYN